MKVSVKSSILVTSLVTMLLLLGWVISRTLMSLPQDAQAQSEEKTLFATPDNLVPLGLSFTPVATNDKLAATAIVEDAAIAAALANEPGLAAATEVVPRLGILGSANQQVALADLSGAGKLVWVITFHGIQTASSGPPDAPRYVSNEYNVVIDALSGDYLLAIPLYDVTPKPPAAEVTPSGSGSDKTLPAENPPSTPRAAPTELSSP